MGEQDRVKTLRRELEGWREILVGLHSILIWEKQFYPAISFSIVSFMYLLVWYIDPAILTLISFIGIIVTLSDYFIPQITPYIFGSNNWTGNDERMYEQIIVSLAGTSDKLSRLFCNLKTMKATRPKMYFACITTSLLTFGYVGSSVNNMFLTYLITLLCVMFPGLRRQDVIRKNFSKVMKQISAVLRSKSSESMKTGEAKAEKRE